MVFVNHIPLFFIFFLSKLLLAYDIIINQDFIIAGKNMEVNIKEYIYNKPIKHKLYLIFKRFADLFLALLFLIILFIPMCIIYILVKKDSSGPAIFKQERLGLMGRPFYIYKFRTMNLDAEKEGPTWSSKDDNRTTKLGKILRKYRIDEIPQLINIIKGEMSFVGPRPERYFFYQEFEKTSKIFKYRLVIKPGLTGWAQVNGGNYLTFEEKIRYDIEYIENVGLFFDIKCMLLTVKSIFKIDKDSDKTNS